MKATGIVRKMDQLGRVVLPMELRRVMNIDPQDPLEIYVEENAIVFKKYYPNCIFCGGSKNITVHKEKNICEQCLNEITSKQY